MIIKTYWDFYKEWRTRRRLTRAIDRANTLHCRYGGRYYVLSLETRRGYKFAVVNQKILQRWRERGYLRNGVTIHQLKERAVYKTK